MEGWEWHKNWQTQQRTKNKILGISSFKSQIQAIMKPCCYLEMKLTAVKWFWVIKMQLNTKIPDEKDEWKLEMPPWQLNWNKFKMKYWNCSSYRHIKIK